MHIYHKINSEIQIKRNGAFDFMTVDVIGGGERESACAERLARLEICSSFSRVTVLPIPTARNGRDITGTDIPLASLAGLSADGVLFCAHGLPEPQKKRITELGGVVADVADDERFVAENAVLTAECTLSYIMSTSKAALADLCVGIVGYGRIGRALLELLLFHGARVTVFTRKDSVRMKLLEDGVDAKLVPEATFDSIDVLVNTAPASLFSKKQIESIRAEVLELASGDNFKGAENLTRLPSLPAKMLPKTAGRLYAEAVVRELEKQGDIK